MNILMMNYEFPPIGGGAANAVYYILKEFSKNKNINIDLITSSSSKFKIEQFSSKITLHKLDIGKKNNLHYQSIRELFIYSFKAFFYAKKLIKNKEYDLIHAFFGIPSGYIAMKLNLPYLVSLRGSDVPFYNKRFFIFDKLFFKRLSRKIWKKSIFTIANSLGLKELAIKTSPKQKVEVIYNGVDVNEFSSKKKYKNTGFLKIISIGRLIKRKGYEYLIKALEGLNDIVELNLIGDGNIKNELEDLADDLNIKINFLGGIKHSKLNDILKKYDLFVLPSLNEGMSNSLLEAMASGLPVIITDVGGSKELVNGNGFIVEKGSPKALREAINKYLRNPDLIAKYGIKSRQIAEKMGWAYVANEYIKLYKNAIR